MKKFFKRTLLVSVMAFSMFFVSACSLFGGDPEDTELDITNYSVSSFDTVVEREDEIDLTGAVLTLTMSDGTTRNINLSNDMIIGAPDLTTTGQKTITVTYEGHQYTLTFNVIPNAHDNYTGFLQDIMQKYENGQVSFSGVTASIDGQATFSFLENSESFTLNETGTLTEAQILQLLQSMDNQGPEKLYEIIRDSVVKAGMQIDENSIFDFNAKTAQLDAKNMLRNIFANALEADYMGIVKQDILVEYEPFFNQMSLGLARQMFMHFDQASVEAIQAVLTNRVYNGFLDNDSVDMNAMLDEIITIIQNSTANEQIKGIYISHMETLRDGEYNRFNSNLIYDAKDFTRFYDNNTFQYVEISEETLAMQGYKETFFAAYRDLVIAFEDINKNDLIDTIDEIEANLTIMNTTQQAIELMGYTLLDMNLEFNFEEAMLVLDTAKDLINLNFAAIDERFSIRELFASVLAQELTKIFYYEADGIPTYSEVEGDVYLLILAQVDSALAGETIDPVQFLTSLENLLGELDGNPLLENFYMTGSFKILTTIAEMDINRSITYYQEQNAPDFAQYEADMNELLLKIKGITEPLDNLFVYDSITQTWEFNFNILSQLEQGVHNYAEYYNDKTMEYDGFVDPLIDTLETLTNYNIDFASRMQNAVDAYKFELVDALTMTTSQFLGISNLDVGYAFVEDWALGLVNDYLNDTLVLETKIQSLLDIVAEYAGTEPKTVIFSVIAVGSLFSSEEIDYNAILANIDLPPQIEEIDFNALIARLKTESTYDFLEISNINVENVLDGSQNLQKQILTITFDADFDVMISSIVGEITLTIELNY